MGTSQKKRRTVAIIDPSLMLIQDNPTSTEGNAFLYRKNKSWLGEFQRFLELMHSNVLLVCIRTLKSEIRYNYHYTCKVVLMACIRIFWSFLASKQQIFSNPACPMLKWDSNVVPICKNFLFIFWCTCVYIYIKSMLKCWDITTCIILALLWSYMRRCCVFDIHNEDLL